MISNRGVRAAAGPSAGADTSRAAVLAGAPPTRLVRTARGPLAVFDVAGAGTPPRRTAVFVPGFTGSKEDFLLLVPPLTAAGHRVVSMDQRGQHESAGSDDPAAYTVAALAADVLDVIDALGTGPVHLVAHSFGGLVARAAVLARPEAAASLTLMSSGPAALSGPRVERMHALAPLLERGGMAAVYDAMALVAAAQTPAPAVPAGRGAFLRHRFLASHPVGLLGMGQAVTTEPDRVAELAALGLPVLVTYGDADDAWSPAVQSAMALRLGARDVVIRGAAHSPAAESPAATARGLLRFWSDVD